MKKCSFCGKEKSKYLRMIQGPGVNICQECIKICNDILEITKETKSLEDELAELNKEHNNLIDKVLRSISNENN